MDNSVTIDPNSIQPIGGAGAPTIDPNSVQPVGGQSSASGQPQQPAQAAPQGDQGSSWRDVAIPGIAGGTGITLGNVANVGENFAKGVEGSLEGAGSILHKGIAKISPSLADEMIDPARLARDKEQSQQLVGSAGEKLAGYGGENLAEWMLGDEALKGLSLGDKFKNISQVASLFEKSPRIMKAVQTGADLEKAAGQLPEEAVKMIYKNPVLARLVTAGMDAVRQSAVSGGQELVKSGGDVKKAGEAALTQGVASGVLGGVGGTLAGVAEKGGVASEAVDTLKNAAETAPSPEEVTDHAKTAVDNAKQAMHAKYEAGIQDLNARLGDTSVPHTGSPIANTAKELTAEPVPATQELVAAAKTAAGERVDKPVKTLLNKAAGDSAASWNVNDLVDFRQAVRKLADTYPSGDLNARTLYKLLPSVDDTLDQVAKASGDTSAKADYAQLRGDYKDKIKYFQSSSNPADKLKYSTAQALQSGTKDQIGKYLFSGGNTRAKVNAVQDLLGPEETQKLGQDVFSSMLQETKPDGTLRPVNPANLVQKWTKIPSEARDTLFDASIGGKAISDLMKDTQSAASIQKLMRATAGGVGGAALGGAPGVFMHSGFGTLLGLAIGEGGGTAAGLTKGRQILDYVANNPAVWKGLGLVAKGAEAAKPAANAVSPAIKYGAGQALKNVMQGAAQPLGAQ